METREPWGGRIVIDPGDLRDVAARLRRAAVTYSSVARGLLRRPVPVMPAHAASAVTEAITRVHRDLQGLALELVDEAASLATRARWAELGEVGERVWSIPGLRHLPRVTDVPSDSTDPPPSASGRVASAEGWALDLLDEMQKSIQEPNDPSGAEPLAGLIFEVERLVEENAGEVRESTFDGFTLLVDLPAAATDLGDVTLDTAEAEAGRTAAGGALATGSSVFSAAPTGAGVAGCLFVGGGLNLSDEIHGGDDVFDE